MDRKELQQKIYNLDTQIELLFRKIDWLGQSPKEQFDNMWLYVKDLLATPDNDTRDIQ